MKDFSYITNSSPAFVENLYQDYLKDPNSIDPDLKKFFEGFDFAISNAAVNGNGKIVTEDHLDLKTPTTEPTPHVDWMQEIRVYRMILGYRNKGHLLAKTNPIRPRKDRGANIELEFYGFTEADLDKQFRAGNLIGLGTTTLRNIYDYLEKCYASHIGIEFKYISDQKKIDWLTNEVEKNLPQPLPLEKKRRILEKLNQGVMFEKFLHTK